MWVLKLMTKKKKKKQTKKKESFLWGVVRSCGYMNKTTTFSHEWNVHLHHHMGRNQQKMLSTQIHPSDTIEGQSSFTWERWVSRGPTDALQSLISVNCGNREWLCGMFPAPSNQHREVQGELEHLLTQWSHQRPDIWPSQCPAALPVGGILSVLPPPSHYTTQVTFLFLRKVLKLAGSSRAALCQPSPEGLCDLNLGAPLARSWTKIQGTGTRC